MIVARQTIPHLNALVNGSKILKEQLSCSIRGCHATSSLQWIRYSSANNWCKIVFRTECSLAARYSALAYSEKPGFGHSLVWIEKTSWSSFSLENITTHNRTPLHRVGIVTKEVNISVVYHNLQSVLRRGKWQKIDLWHMHSHTKTTNFLGFWYHY